MIYLSNLQKYLKPIQYIISTKDKKLKPAKRPNKPPTFAIKSVICRLFEFTNSEQKKYSVCNCLK